MNPLLDMPLLHRLRDAGGEFIAMSDLGMDLEVVREGLDALEAFGFALERHPYRGVAYRGPAGRLCPDQIEFDLGTRRLGRRIAVWNRVTSTNDLAARGAGSSANEGLVVLAEEQTAGRGRRGRTWTAPPATSLLMSVLLFPPADLDGAGWLTALGAVATAEVVAVWTGLDVRIKWPNDVRVGSCKIAGVLVERGPAAVIGIGLNANLAASDFPTDLRGSATSLAILGCVRVDRSELARDLIRRLDEWYDRGRREGAETLNGPWRDRSEHLGRVARVRTPAGEVVGLLDDLHLRDGLTLSNPDGPSRRIPIHEVLALSTSEAGPEG